MKIIVNSEREKEIIGQFTDFLADWIDDKKMEVLLKHAEYEFEPHELELIQLAFHQVNPKVDEKEYPVYLQADNLCGECKYCGGQWQGIEDESIVTIDEYEQYLNLQKEEGYHAECLREYQCVRCGSDEETNEFEGIGRLCTRCDGDRLTYRISESEARRRQSMYLIIKEESE